MTKKRGLTGNESEIAAMQDQELRNSGMTLLKLGHYITKATQQDWYIHALKFVGLDGSRGDVLLVVNAYCGDDHYVAFLSGGSVTECLQSLVRQLRADKVKWKEDEYAKPK